METIISSVGHLCPTQGQGCPNGGCEACESALRNAPFVASGRSPTDGVATADTPAEEAGLPAVFRPTPDVWGETKGG